MKSKINTIVSTLLRNDEFPSDRYCPFSFGESVGVELKDEKDAAIIVREVFKELPCGMASSFCEGIVKHWNGKLMRIALFDAISTARVINSAAAIVELLITRLQMQEKGVYQELELRVRMSNNEDEQDRLCFAIWSIFCSETLDLEEDVLHIKSPKLDQSKVQGLIESNNLNKYCQRLLIMCTAKVGDTGKSRGHTSF